MKKFTTLKSRMVPLPVDNIDTDQIIPARFLKTISKDGLGAQLFHDWRYDASGAPRPDFVLNQHWAAQCQVLLAGDNFGCGSSREHAPWALTQYGFRAIISTSFADIFRQNSLKNSLLPVIVPPEIHKELLALVAQQPEAEVVIDLASQKLGLPDGREVEFPVDPFARQCLMEGVDELGYILIQQEDIAAYEAKNPGWINTLTP